jgi:ubiquinone/menaquinone biosynthesis C-methylase UbiE
MTERDQQAARQAEWAARAHTYATYALPKNRPFAARLVELLAIRPGSRVLDVAAGPGPVAVAAAQAAGPSGSVLATDISPVWEKFIAAEAAAAGVATVAFRAMPGEALDLEDGGFDVAACQFGLMFMSDASTALRHMRRVLRPHGRLGVAVWSTPDKVGHFRPMRALQESLPEDPSTAQSPSPLSMGAPGLIEGLVQEACFEHIELHRFTAEHIIEDPEQEWLRLTQEGAFADRLALLDEAHRARSKAAVLDAIESMRRHDQIVVSSEALIVTARKPA